MKTKVIFLSCILILSLLLIAPAFARNAGTTGMPDVLIFVDARKVGANAVSITYPKVVTRTQAEAALSNLLRETGWSAASVNITDGSIMKSGEFPMTAVEFNTPSAIQADGVITIEPIVRAFRNTTNIQVQYLTSPTVYVSSLGSFENKYVKITLNRGINAYRYSIRIKDSGFEDLGLPKPAAERNASTRAVGQGSRVTIIATVLIIMLALMAATLAYIFTARFTRNRKGDFAQEASPRLRPPGAESPRNVGGKRARRS